MTAGERVGIVILCFIAYAIIGGIVYALRPMAIRGKRGVVPGDLLTDEDAWQFAASFWPFAIVGIVGVAFVRGTAHVTERLVARFRRKPEPIPKATARSERSDT